MRTPLEKHIWSWMNNTLSEPRVEFNGQPPCPWIRKYRDRIIVREVTSGIKKPIENAASLIVPLKLMAICLAFPKKPPIAKIRSAADKIINDELFEHLDILINDHRLRGTVQGFYTGYTRCDLVIIQDSEMLKRARNLTKRSGYYNNC
mgnify:FL=1